MKENLQNNSSYKLLGQTLFLAALGPGGVDNEMQKLEDLAQQYPEIKAALISLLPVTPLDPYIHKKVLLAKLASSNLGVDTSCIDDWMTRMDQFPTTDQVKTGFKDWMWGIYGSVRPHISKIGLAKWGAGIVALKRYPVAAACLEVGSWIFYALDEVLPIYTTKDDAKESILLQGAYDYFNNTNNFKTAYDYIVSIDRKPNIFENNTRQIVEQMPTQSQRIVKTILRNMDNTNVTEVTDKLLTCQLEKITSDLAALKEANRNQVDEIQRQQKLATIAYEDQERQSAIQLAALIFNRVNPNTAKIFYSSATSLNKFFNAICTFKAGGPVGWLSVASAGAGVLDTIAGLLLGTQSNEEILLKGMREVRDAVVSMHKDMNTGFSVLANGQLAICRKLDLLFQDIREIKNNLTAINSKLDAIKRDIDTLRQEAITRNIETHLREFADDKDRVIIKVESDYPLSEIEEALGKIFSHGLSVAKFQDFSGPKECDSFKGFTNDLERNHNTIIYTICRQVKTDLKKDLLVDFDSAINPIEWARAALIILYAIARKPKLLEIDRVQNKLEQFWKAGVQCKVVTKIAGSKAMVTLAAQNYLLSASDLLWKMDELIEPKLRVLIAARKVALQKELQSHYRKDCGSSEIDKAIKALCEDIITSIKKTLKNEIDDFKFHAETLRAYVQMALYRQMGTAFDIDQTGGVYSLLFNDGLFTEADLFSLWSHSMGEMKKKEGKDVFELRANSEKMTLRQKIIDESIKNALFTVSALDSKQGFPLIDEIQVLLKSFLKVYAPSLTLINKDDHIVQLCETIKGKIDPLVEKMSDSTVAGKVAKGLSNQQSQKDIALLRLYYNSKAATISLTKIESRNKYGTWQTGNHTVSLEVGSTAKIAGYTFPVKMNLTINGKSIQPNAVCNAPCFQILRMGSEGNIIITYVQQTDPYRFQTNLNDTSATSYGISIFTPEGKNLLFLDSKSQALPSRLKVHSKSIISIQMDDGIVETRDLEKQKILSNVHINDLVFVDANEKQIFIGTRTEKGSQLIIYTLETGEIQTITL